jgi:hypothetical protein
MADAELAGGVRGRDLPRMPGDRQQVKTQRMGERADGDRIIEQPEPLPGRLWLRFWPV